MENEQNEQLRVWLQIGDIFQTQSWKPAAHEDNNMSMAQTAADSKAVGIQAKHYGNSSVSTVESVPML